MALAALVGSVIAPARAATLTWGTSGTGGDGSWTDGAGGWWNGSAANWTNGDSAIFQGTPGTVTLGGPVTSGSVLFTVDGYTVTGNTLTLNTGFTANGSATIGSAVALGAGNSWSVAAGKTLTLNGVVSGAQTLTYGGSGTYAINGINTNSGNLTISGATVNVAAGATLFGSGLGWAGRTVTLSNGGALGATNWANGAGSLWGEIGDSANNIIFGTGGGTFIMSGTVMDSTVNKGFDVGANVTGTFFVPTGVSTAWNGSNSGRDFNVNSGGTLVFGGDGNFSTSRYLRGAGGVTKTGAGTLTLTQSGNSFTGPLTVSSGTVNAAVGTSGGTGSAIGGGGNTVNIGGGGTLLFSGGSRTAGYHTGDVNINGGTITFNTLDNSFAVGKTVTLGTSAATINGSGQWRFRGGATMRVLAAANGSTISVANLDLYDGTETFNIDSGATLIVSSSVTNSGGGNLLKTGSGAMVLSSANSTFSGAVTVRAGTLVAGANAPSGSAGAFGNATSAIVVGDGSTGAADGPGVLIGGAYTVGRAISVGSVSNANAWTPVLGGTNTTGTATFSGSVTLGTTASGYTGLLLRAAPGGTVDFSGTWTTNNKPVTVGSAGNTGTVKVSSAMATTGGVSVNAGTLLLGTASALGGTTPVTMGGGTLDVAAFAATIGTFSGSGTITGTTGGVLTVTQAVDGTFSGAFTGAAGLTKAGASTLTLNGASTTTGAVTVNAGSLVVGSGGSLTNAAVTAASGASLVVNAGGSIAGSTVTINGGGSLAGAGTSGTTTVLNGGGLAPGASGVGTLTLSTLTFGTTAGDTATVSIPTTGLTSIPATLQVNGDVVTNGGVGSVTFAFGNLSNVVTGTYSLISYTGSLASGTTPFSYTGTLSGRQGVDFQNATGALSLVISNAFPIWSGSNGTGWSTTDNWKLNTDNAPTSFQANDSVVFGDGAATGTVEISGANVNPASTTFSGTSLAYTLQSTGDFGISTGALVKSGAATLTITNSNSFAGGTTLSAGVLRIGNDAALGTGTVALNGGTLSSDSGSARTLANAAAIGGNVTLGNATDNGNLTLSGSVSLGGATRQLTIASPVTISGPLSSGGITKAGSSVLTLSASNSFAGGVTLSAGTIRVGNDTALGSGAVALNAGTLSSDSTSARSLPNAVTIGGAVTLGDATNNGNLTFSGGVGLGGAARQITTPSNVTFSGAVSNGVLVKSGTGRLTLSGVNTYTSSTVSQGTLQANGTGALPGSVSIASGATLVLNQDNVTWSNTLTGSGTATLMLSAAGGQTYVTGIGGFNGTVQVTSTASTANKWRTNTLNAPNVTAVIDPGNTLYVTGATTFATIRVSGTGNTENLGAIRLYAGPLNGSVSLLGDTTIGADATNTVAANVSAGASGTSVLTLGTPGASSSMTFSGTIANGTGTVALAVAYGTQTLSNSANTFTGGATISGGVLAFASGALGSSGAVTMNGGTLQWASGNTQDVSSRITLVNGQVATFDTNGNNVSLASGFGAGSTAGLTKIGAGTLTLSGVDTFTGQTLVRSGTLALAGGQFGTGGNNGTSRALNIGPSAGDNATFSVASGTIVQSGGAGLMIGDSGTGTFSQSGGSVTLGGGGLWIGDNTTGVGTATFSGGTFTNTGGATVLATRNQGTITVSGSANVSLGTLQMGYSGIGVSTQSATVNLEGGRLAVTGVTNASGTGTFCFNSGTLTARANNASFMTGLTTAEIKAGGAIVDTNGFGITIGQSLAESVGSTGGGLTKLGSGTLTLAGANTYTGTTAVQAGTLALGLTNAIPAASAITLGSAGARGFLDLTTRDLTTASLTFTGLGGELPTGASGELLLQNLTTGTALVSAVSGSSAIHPTMRLSTNASFAVTTSATLALHGTINGTGTLFKTGSGTLTLHGASSWSGGTQLQQGTVAIVGGNPLAFGTGTITLGDFTTLDLGGAAIDNTIVFASGTANVGVSILNSGTWVSLSGPGAIASGSANYKLLSTADIVFQGAVPGSVLIESGGKGVFESAANGSVTVNAGGQALLQGDVNDLVSSGSTTIQGTVLDTVSVTGGTTTISGNTSIGSLIETGTGSAATTIFTGTVAGGAHVGAAGIGDFRSLVSGQITTDAGGTALLKDGFSSTGGSIQNEGSLVVDRTTDLTLAAPIGGAGSLTKQGATTLTLSGSSDYSGGTTISAGTVALSGAGAIAGPVSLAASTALDISGASGNRTIGALSGTAGSQVVLGGNTLTVGDATSTAFAGVISGSGGLTKAGAGILTLADVQAFTGAARVDVGTLAIGGTNTLAAANKIYVASGATLDATAAGLGVVSGQTLGGYGTIAGNVNFLDGSILSPGGSVGSETASSASWNSGFTYLFEVNNASGTAGLSAGGWDLFTVTGTLTLAASIGDPITIDLTSLAGSDPGLAANFDPNFNYAWKFAVAGAPISTFDATWFTVSSGSFQNLPNDPGFYVARGDQLPTGYAAGTSSELYVVYAAVPEPGTLVLAGVGLAGIVVMMRRRQRGV